MPTTAMKEVLVLDGLEFYRQMMTELLTAQGYRVRGVDDATAALDLMAEESFDLLLLDLELPSGGAGDFLREASARGIRPSHTVLLAPTDSDADEVESLRDSGVAACVPRSAPIDDIVSAARSALFPDQAELRRSLRAQVRIPVVFGTGTGDGELSTHTFNLSADGMFLVTPSSPPPAPGTRLELRFWVPTAAEVVRCSGIVIWCNQAGGRMNQLYPPGMGVMFLGLPEASARSIDDYVRDRATPPV